MWSSLDERLAVHLHYDNSVDSILSIIGVIRQDYVCLFSAVYLFLEKWSVFVKLPPNGARTTIKS